MGGNANDRICLQIYLLMSMNSYLHLGNPPGHLLRHQGAHHKLLRGKKKMILYTLNIFVVEHHHIQYLDQIV